MKTLFILLWTILITQPAWADLFSKGENPDWVTITEIPIEKPENIPFASDGVYYLLSDKQMIWDETTRYIYARLAIKVLNHTGLKTAATVYYNVDPAFEELKLTEMRRIRDGVSVDLKGQSKFQVFQRETDLERGIIDGRKTVYYDMPDVQVGDTVVTTVIWKETPRYDGATFAGSNWMEYTVPVGKTLVTLNWPSDKKIAILPTTKDVDLHIVAGDGFTSYRWSRDDIKPLPYEDRVPSDHVSRAYISYSGYENWSTVADAFRDYYNQSHVLPAEWQQKIASIRATYDTPSDQAIAALRLVQDEIRYVGIEIGAGGYFARSPETVISHGFGDCKDKSLLLKTILGELGITAEVALAHLSDGLGISKRQPSGDNFDHMITRAKLNGKWFWMDPTGINEAGSVKTSAVPNYGYVLPLTKEPGNDLVLIEENEQNADRMEFTEMFYFNMLGVALSVESIYFGDAANHQRSYWMSNSPSEIHQGYLDYYARNYSGIRALKLASVTDDRENNIFRVVESYFLPKFAIKSNNLEQEFPFLGERYLNYLVDLRVNGRRSPLNLPYHFKRLHRIVVKNAPIEFTPPKLKTVTNDAFSYRFSAKSRPGGYMELVWSLKTNANQVPANQVADIVQAIKESEETAHWTWDITPDDEMPDTDKPD